MDCYLTYTLLTGYLFNFLNIISNKNRIQYELLILVVLYRKPVIINYFHVKCTTAGKIKKKKKQIFHSLV